MGCFWCFLGASWVPPGASCGVLGGSWGLLEAPWEDLSGLLGSLGGLLGSLGGLLRLLASSWKPAGDFWYSIGGSSGVFGRLGLHKRSPNPSLHPSKRSANARGKRRDPGRSWSCLGAQDGPSNRLSCPPKRTERACWGVLNGSWGVLGPRERFGTF